MVDDIRVLIVLVKFCCEVLPAFEDVAGDFVDVLLAHGPGLPPFTVTCLGEGQRAPVAVDNSGGVGGTACAVDDGALDKMAFW